ncbi:MAG TPA: hypothetical protein VD866_13690 [Urbifossiella sp.]|nr:hypothetical protein [Urbifossiella sp.]
MTILSHDLTKTGWLARYRGPAARALAGGRSHYPTRSHPRLREWWLYIPPITSAEVSRCHP